MKELYRKLLPTNRYADAVCCPAQNGAAKQTTGRRRCQSNAVGTRPRGHNQVNKVKAAVRMDYGGFKHLGSMKKTFLKL